MLLSWLRASSSAKNAEEIETAKVIRALTRHGLLCHFKCYTTEASKTLSLVRNNTELLIWDLHKLCEHQAPSFMTPKLVDVLVQVYEVQQDEFHESGELQSCELWVLKLKSERDKSTEVRMHVHKLVRSVLTLKMNYLFTQAGTSFTQGRLSPAVEDGHDPSAASAQFSFFEQPQLDSYTSPAQDANAEETEKEIASSTPSPVLSPSSD